MWWWLCAAIAATEMPYDGVDQDGDGADLVDVDGDGWASALAFGADCNDRDDRVHPGARDVAGDGVDADCDGADGGPPRVPWRTAGLGVVAALLLGLRSTRARPPADIGTLPTARPSARRG